MALLTESCLSTSFTHASYNALHSVNNLIHHTLPAVVNLILTDDSDQFGVRILRALNEFIRRLFIILMILGEYRTAKQFLTEMIAIGLESMQPTEFFCFCNLRSKNVTEFLLFFSISKSTRCCSGITESGPSGHQQTTADIPGNDFVLWLSCNC